MSSFAVSFLGLTGVLRGFLGPAILGLHPAMASSYQPNTPATDGRSDDDSGGDGSASEESQADDSQATRTSQSTATATTAADGVPVDDSDLQAVIDQYERLLDTRTSELERAKDDRPHERSGFRARVRAFLQSLR